MSDQRQSGMSWGGRLCRALFFVSSVWCLTVLQAEHVRSVQGFVRDQSGNPLPGAVVEIEDRTTLQVRSYITEKDGAYRFGDLLPDLTYHLRAKYGEVFGHSKNLSKYSSKDNTRVDLTVEVPKTK